MTDLPNTAPNRGDLFTSVAKTVSRLQAQYLANAVNSKRAPLEESWQNFAELPASRSIMTRFHYSAHFSSSTPPSKNLHSAEAMNLPAMSTPPSMR